MSHFHLPGTRTSGRLAESMTESVAAVYFSLATLLATVVTILACATPNFQTSSWVFGDTSNSTGWQNPGLLFVLCLLNNAYGFLGTDAGAHLSEEIPNPMVNVPKAIVSGPCFRCVMFVC
jgi:amino acid transporter